MLEVTGDDYLAYTCCKKTKVKERYNGRITEQKTKKWDKTKLKITKRINSNSHQNVRSTLHTIVIFFRGERSKQSYRFNSIHDTDIFACFKSIQIV